MSKTRIKWTSEQTSCLPQGPSQSISKAGKQQLTKSKSKSMKRIQTQVVTDMQDVFGMVQSVDYQDTIMKIINGIGIQSIVGAIEKVISIGGDFREGENMGVGGTVAKMHRERVKYAELLYFHRHQLYLQKRALQQSQITPFQSLQQQHTLYLSTLHSLSAYFSAQCTQKSVLMQTLAHHHLCLYNSLLSYIDNRIKVNIAQRVQAQSRLQREYMHEYRKLKEEYDEIKVDKDRKWKNLFILIKDNRVLRRTKGKLIRELHNAMLVQQQLKQSIVQLTKENQRYKLLNQSIEQQQQGFRQWLKNIASLTKFQHHIKKQPYRSKRILESQLQTLQIQQLKTLPQKIQYIIKAINQAEQVIDYYEDMTDLIIPTKLLLNNYTQTQCQVEDRGINTVIKGYENRGVQVRGHGNGLEMDGRVWEVEIGGAKKGKKGGRREGGEFVKGGAAGRNGDSRNFRIMRCVQETVAPRYSISNAIKTYIDSRLLYNLKQTPAVLDIQISKPIQTRQQKPITPTPHNRLPTLQSHVKRQQKQPKQNQQPSIPKMAALSKLSMQKRLSYNGKVGRRNSFMSKGSRISTLGNQKIGENMIQKEGDDVSQNQGLFNKVESEIGSYSQSSASSKSRQQQMVIKKNNKIKRSSLRANGPVLRHSASTQNPNKKQNKQKDRNLSNFGKQNIQNKYTNNQINQAHGRISERVVSNRTSTFNSYELQKYMHLDRLDKRNSMVCGNKGDKERRGSMNCTNVKGSTSFNIYQCRKSVRNSENVNMNIKLQSDEIQQTNQFLSFSKNNDSYILPSQQNRSSFQSLSPQPKSSHQPHLRSSHQPHLRSSHQPHLRQSHQPLLRTTPQNNLFPSTKLSPTSKLSGNIHPEIHVHEIKQENSDVSKTSSKKSSFSSQSSSSSSQQSRGVKDKIIGDYRVGQVFAEGKNNLLIGGVRSKGKSDKSIVKGNNYNGNANNFSILKTLAQIRTISEQDHQNQPRYEPDQSQKLLNTILSSAVSHSLSHKTLPPQPPLPLFAPSKSFPKLLHILFQNRQQLKSCPRTLQSFLQQNLKNILGIHSIQSQYPIYSKLLSLYGTFDGDQEMNVYIQSFRRMLNSKVSGCYLGDLLKIYAILMERCGNESLCVGVELGVKVMESVSVIFYPENDVQTLVQDIKSRLLAPVNPNLKHKHPSPISPTLNLNNYFLILESDLRKNSQQTQLSQFLTQILPQNQTDLNYMQFQQLVKFLSFSHDVEIHKSRIKYYCQYQKEGKEEGKARDKSGEKGSKGNKGDKDKERERGKLMGIKLHKLGLYCWREKWQEMTNIIQTIQNIFISTMQQPLCVQELVYLLSRLDRGQFGQNRSKSSCPWLYSIVKNHIRKYKDLNLRINRHLLMLIWLIQVNLRIQNMNLLFDNLTILNEVAKTHITKYQLNKFLNGNTNANVNINVKSQEKKDKFEGKITKQVVVQKNSLMVKEKKVGFENYGLKQNTNDNGNKSKAEAKKKQNLALKKMRA